MLKYTPTSTSKSFVKLSSSEVSKEKKYIQFLPLYSVRAACGSFEDNAFIPENGAEGWIEITETGVNINENMFIVHAVGDSMLPLIKDGDLCLFELYNTESCADREGNIVLTQCSSKDGDYDCSYTIKKYHSEKSINEDGTWQHTKVELISLNPDYDTIELYKDGDYKTVGIFKCVL